MIASDRLFPALTTTEYQGLHPDLICRDEGR